MKTINVAVSIVLKDPTGSECQAFIQKREENGPLDGMWEFPGGKIRSLESAESAARRELAEETGLKTQNLKFFKKYNHEYSDRKVAL
ncbi:MAG: NUDIX domain-containing protein [Bacteriovoracaceae bacterium]|nr:NUDIX domain-containing protein [Bacteriovoracaceae bacterium]